MSIDNLYKKLLEIDMAIFELKRQIELEEKLDSITQTLNTLRSK